MLSNISLENFRNHKKTSLELDNCTILVGPNGAGKSNILEAVLVLSSCRSFRQEDKKNLVQNGSDYARIKGGDLEIFIQKNPRLLLQAKERGVVRKVSDFIGIMPTVVFSPETLDILTGAPAERRRFFDIMISQTDREYLTALMYYQKVKKQKNILLQRIAEGLAKHEELDFWSDEMRKNSEIIQLKREKAVIEIAGLLPVYYSKIAGVSDVDLKLVYEKSVIEPKGSTQEMRELAAKKTLYGTHRDNFSFLLNDNHAENYASRGEIRSIVLALKFSELDYIDNHLHSVSEKPILLLDDVFSEFDSSRRTFLGDLVLNYQSIITTTDRDHLSDKLTKNAKVIEIRKEID